MIRRILSIALVTAMAPLSSAASELTAGENMPELRGEYLSGRKAILPRDASGRAALLLFGFTYQSRLAVEAWTKRFREDFGKFPELDFALDLFLLVVVLVPFEPFRTVVLTAHLRYFDLCP